MYKKEASGLTAVDVFHAALTDCCDDKDIDQTRTRIRPTGRRWSMFSYQSFSETAYIHSE